ncbi:YbcC family protein [Parasphingorhabdus sp.]|uniref:YbcC family protein n=1 Tax=Parasphingorhabdus sp. TaxID=2709688 RepID=UPI003A8F3D70
MLDTMHANQDIDLQAIADAADEAARAIPPAWPLASSVAVNPFLGQTDQTLAGTGALLGRATGASITMPRAWYREKIEQGEISDADLKAALSAARETGTPSSLAELKQALASDPAALAAIPTVADLAAKASAIDWPGIASERFGVWAAGHFDAGQALWAAPKDKSAYAAWRAIATHDLTPEIAGLSGFARFVADAPDNASDAIVYCCDRLGLLTESMASYFHRLLSDTGGWAQYARYLLWQAELAEQTDRTILDCLAIRLIWETALLERYDEHIADQWADAIARHAQPARPAPEMVIDAIMQEAHERAFQRQLASMLAASPEPATGYRPALQMAFCIDVRSEVFRRSLEAQDPSIQTIGFAGFFGLTTAHRRFASDEREHRLPVLLNPGLESRSGGPEDIDADRSSRYTARAVRAWGRFKLAAVSSFAFVEASGPLYVVKLVRDALGLSTKTKAADPAPQIVTEQSLDDRVAAAEGILRAMSMTDNFARLVILAGHGASVTNNPHYSALNCGACGGYSGEVNARLLAALLNDADVRQDLQAKGIAIPADCLFLAALHDTTTDQVTIYDQDHDTADHKDDLAETRIWLAAAGARARTERALRLPRADGAQDIHARSSDWSEVRPEWGLAGCSAFIAAPRSRSTGRDLAGRSFLHDYDWQQDDGFNVLELILTAPVVVASWISLQYYGSTVMPEQFGGGNKLLHNVVGGIGVIEGNGGPLRAGLPWQSVHDGNNQAHDPLRLSVCVEAPREAITAILEKHEGVRALFDNRWLHLFALDENGQMAWRYVGKLGWEAVAVACPEKRT